MAILTSADLGGATDGADEALVDALVAGANAQATRVAPCLVDTTDQAVLDEARMVLIGAVKRWLQAGSGAVTQQTAGPFSFTVDTRSGRSGYSFWPSETATLRLLCGAETEADAFTVDMTPEPLSPTLYSRPDLWFQWL